MPIPALDNRGLLPPGIHDCTLDEIGSAFSKSKPDHKRAQLFERFKAFVELAKSISWIKTLYVDGSFVTDKANPEDIDVAIDLPKATPEVSKMLRNSAIFNREQMKEKFSVDVLPTVGASDFASFFESLRPKDAHRRGLKATAKKGILRVTI